jgi:hypothetical protein
MGLEDREDFFVMGNLLALQHPAADVAGLPVRMLDEAVQPDV